MQVLRLVVVVHGLRQLELDAAEQIDGLREELEVDHGAGVGRKAAEAAQLPPQALERVAAAVGRAGVDGVELSHLPVQIHQRVPRDADEVEPVPARIQPREQDRVRTAAGVVPTGQQQRVDPVPARAVRVFRGERLLSARRFPGGRGGGFRRFADGRLQGV